MIRFSLLGSGSRGNAILVTTENGKVLIDNGLSFRQLQLRAARLGQSVEDVGAVFVTHEHRDHVNGLGVIARKLKVPVFVTRPTYENLPSTVGDVPNVHFFEAGDVLGIGGLEVSSFSVSHDAVDPVSYVVRAQGIQLGIASDLGHAPRLVKQRLAGSHALIMESNYCPDMLMRGSYPPQVQQRIRGKHGHLSNGDMNSLLAELLHDDLRLVVLAHVSQENNTAELAHSMAARVMDGHQAQLFVATQDEPTPFFEVSL